MLLVSEDREVRWGWVGAAGKGGRRVMKGPNLSLHACTVLKGNRGGEQGRGERGTTKEQSRSGLGTRLLTIGPVSLAEFSEQAGTDPQACFSPS